MYAFLIAWR